MNPSNIISAILFLLLSVSIGISSAGVVNGNQVGEERDAFGRNGGLLETAIKFMADVGVITAEDLQVRERGLWKKCTIAQIVRIFCKTIFRHFFHLARFSVAARRSKTQMPKSDFLPFLKD